MDAVAPFSLVIDTNIWLDLLVFDDPVTRRLGGLIAADPNADADDAADAADASAADASAGAATARSAAARPRVLATEAMRAELADVLTRPRFGLTADRQQALLRRYDAWIAVVDDAPDCRLAISDADDRKFLDLAVSHRVAWLLSRDRALLKARRPAARRFDLAIGAVPDFYRWLDTRG